MVSQVILRATGRWNVGIGTAPKDVPVTLVWLDRLPTKGIGKVGDRSLWA